MEPDSGDAEWMGGVGLFDAPERRQRVSTVTPIWTP